MTIHALKFCAHQFAALVRDDFKLLFECPHAGILRSLRHVNMSSPTLHPTFGPICAVTVALAYFADLGVAGRH